MHENLFDTMGNWSRVRLSVGVVAASLGATAVGVVDAAPPTVPGPAELFHTSDRCIGCHNGLTTPRGQDVSIGYDWRASMMGNAARDPYWQASVRRETLDHPKLRDAIEDKCSICHMAMSRVMHQSAGGTGKVFAHLPIGKSTTPEAQFAADGVSCTVCHQVTPKHFGTEQSYTGGFVIDTTRPIGQRVVYGPFETDSGRRRIMHSATKFEPTKGSHLAQSEMCATCHTLYTHARDDNGREVGQLPEQVPYLEWKHSSYRRKRSCQSCHMPSVAVPTSITSVLPKPRADVSRHVFRGGNFFMPRLLNRFRAQLGVVALPQELQATVRRTTDHLKRHAANVSVERAVHANGVLEVDVSVKSLAGHKLPTAYPSRRVWLRFAAHDDRGRLLFESGRLTSRGQIVGNDNDASRDSGSQYEPHYDLIERGDQVQIYEAIMVDANGRVTTGLLRGVRYVKDNRVLPNGFDKSTADADIAVRGKATTDANFDATGDRVRYRVPIGVSEGSVRVRVELWYQPIGYRWAENLSIHNTAETNRFVSSYRSLADVSAVILAQDEQRVAPAASE